jgi:Raf kinase inhibitor-like YbhB/YbcL family protein
MKVDKQMALALKSRSFTEGGAIPKAHTCDGANRSPAFTWTGVPQGAKSLLLVCDDPEAPQGVFHHWAAYNIPPDWTGLKSGLGSAEPGCEQALNDFGKHGYTGPCPPRSDRAHGYHFRLSALGDRIEAGPAADCIEIQRLAASMQICSTELIGFYAR